MIKLQNHLLTNFPEYLRSITFSLCFCFEQLVSYTDKKILMKGRKATTEERWDPEGVKAVEVVRVIVPSPYGKAQVYVAKNGSAMHGQRTMSEIISDAIRLKDFPPHIIIWNDRNYSDQFMLVVNEIPSDGTLPLPDPVRVLQCALESVVLNKDGTRKRKRNGNYEVKKNSSKKRAGVANDVGVSGPQGSMRGSIKANDGTSNHHSKPPMLKHTFEYADIIRACSLIMASHHIKPSWIPKGKKIYSMEGHPNYIEEFAGTLSNDFIHNVVPAARSSLVWPDQRCGDHFDPVNGKYPLNEAIGGCSWNNETGQLRLNWSSRDSQDGYVKRTQQYQLLSDMTERFVSFSDERK